MDTTLAERSRHFTRMIMHGLYRVARPVVFLVNSEVVHEVAVRFGEKIGSVRFFRRLLGGTLVFKDGALFQTLSGIHFENPLGLSAGFDYEARLTEVIGTIGFGFATIGTVTCAPYEGNSKPRLGRLPKSRSLLVNKGFKNLGVEKTLARLSGKQFSVPVGISIGKTNTLDIKTQSEAVLDVCKTFSIVENSDIPFSYYELNISCPNLKGNIEFYEPAHLDELLKDVFARELSRPVFIKMPIIKTNEETLAMLDVISRYKVAGVILGNLQNDRSHKTLVKGEIDKYPKGNLSGIPTQERSNELIRIAYQKYGKHMIIIGTGGIFSAEDAYKKIRAGASLLQMITGMIFEGPQLPAQINEGLAKLLRRDGYKNISEAVGVDAR
ncbi:MAG: quinone-dependent dihydroorotate dehydrogenase [Candidatus Pacebacteria bacterium]|nr:quinone-dependent dihydroorotate dehydrogenase [Candidatus Paceibacterota bacterium]